MQTACYTPRRRGVQRIVKGSSNCVERLAKGSAEGVQELGQGEKATIQRPRSTVAAAHRLAPVLVWSERRAAQGTWRWFERVDVRRPNLFIAGAPRCATTSLWSYLKSHPEIFMSTPKELYFFDADLRREERREQTVEQYLTHFSAAVDQKKVGEATPSYLCSKHAPGEIKAFSPEAQIIIMLRNPVDVMHSLHSSALYGLEPITDFGAALEADARRSRRDQIGYRELTDFPEQVRRYFDVFGRENVHAIVYEDLKEGPATVCQSVLRFLGVRLDFAAEFPQVNPSTQVRNTHLEMILVRPPRKLRAISRALVPQWLRSRIRHTLLDANRKVGPNSPMDPDLRRRLQKESEPKVEQLSELLGRDLSGWCKKLAGEGRDGDDQDQEDVERALAKGAT
jgi:hypothetical protein